MWKVYTLESRKSVHSTQNFRLQCTKSLTLYNIFGTPCTSNVLEHIIFHPAMKEFIFPISSDNFSYHLMLPFGRYKLNFFHFMPEIDFLFGTQKSPGGGWRTGLDNCLNFHVFCTLRALS